jgi:hypothetical protein
MSFVWTKCTYIYESRAILVLIIIGNLLDVSRSKQKPETSALTFCDFQLDST